jgi:hypothetical protein
VKARSHWRAAYALLHSQGAPYNRNSGKSDRACQWLGRGQLSVDGSGHYNPNWSEDPWGRAVRARMTVSGKNACPTQCGIPGLSLDRCEGWKQTDEEAVYAGSRLKQQNQQEGSASFMRYSPVRRGWSNVQLHGWRRLSRRTYCLGCGHFFCRDSGVRHCNSSLHASRSLIQNISWKRRLIEFPE